MGYLVCSHVNDEVGVFKAAKHIRTQLSDGQIVTISLCHECFDKLRTEVNK